MHVVGKLTKYDGEDFYNDECNIDDMEEKFAVPDEIVLLLEGNKETGKYFCFDIFFPVNS